MNSEEIQEVLNSTDFKYAKELRELLREYGCVCLAGSEQMLSVKILKWAMAFQRDLSNDSYMRKMLDKDDGPELKRNRNENHTERYQRDFE